MLTKREVTTSEELTIYYESEINYAFKWMHSTTGVPCITYSSYGMAKKVLYPISEVVAESIYEGSEAHAALMRALSQSTCPYVEDLKQAICDEYKSKNVDELVQFDIDRGV